MRLHILILQFVQKFLRRLDDELFVGRPEPWFVEIIKRLLFVINLTSQYLKHSSSTVIQVFNSTGFFGEILRSIG